MTLTLSTVSVATSRSGRGPPLNITILSAESRAISSAWPAILRSCPAAVCRSIDTSSACAERVRLPSMRSSNCVAMMRSRSATVARRSVSSPAWAARRRFEVAISSAARTLARAKMPSAVRRTVDPSQTASTRLLHSEKSPTETVIRPAVRTLAQNIETMNRKTTDFRKVQAERRARARARRPLPLVIVWQRPSGGACARWRGQGRGRSPRPR